uniref:Uncharacterized protein n=1 Tax=Oryza rufipogon TaxID=4529 RepID=A0A0E0PMH2_ORYRU
MSGSVPLDASTSISGGWPSWWMVTDLLTINFISVAPVEGDAMGDELVVMMGLARELTAMQRARAMT